MAIWAHVWCDSRMWELLGVVPRLWNICVATAVDVSLSFVCVQVSVCVYLWGCIRCPCSSDHSMISEIPISHWPV